MKSDNNITVRYLNLKEHQFYEAYLYDDEIMETKEIALNYYHYNLGYPALSDEFLFFNIAICFFWDDLYDEKLTSYNLGIVLDNFQKFRDITPLKKLSSLNKKDIKSKIEKAKTFNFRDKLYLDLSKFYVDFIPQDSPIVNEYIEKLDEEILQAITFKFLLNRSKEDYIEFFEVYIYDYEEEEIDSFMKESKKHFSNFKKFINKDNLDGFENYMSEFDEEMIELYPIFAEFIMEKYKKEIIVELLDDNFDEYVIKRFELIKKIISSFSDIQLLKIIERLSSNMKNNIFLGKILLYVFIDEKLFLVYPLDKWNKIENYIYLWHDFLIDIGVNIEILAINQSKHKISRLLNTYKEHGNKIEVKYTYLDDDGTINKKTEKLNINNNHELINKWSVIENIYENKDDVSIILNKKEVQFEDIASVFDCLLEKTGKELNRDYCSFNEDGYPIETNCRLLSEIFPEIDLEKYYFDEKEYCFLNGKNIIIFNKDKISKDYKKTINYMQICPFFKKLRVKNSLKDFLNMLIQKQTIIGISFVKIIILGIISKINGLMKMEN